MKQFEATVIILENGEEAKVKHQVRNVVSHADAERVLTECYVEDDLQDIEKLSPTKYSEWLFNETLEEPKYFKVTIAYLEMNEKTGKEKETKSDYFVESEDLPSAMKAVEDSLKGVLSDWKFAGSRELKINGWSDGVNVECGADMEEEEGENNE